jgi:predicted nuclease of predicted toxin-antitoxin system
LTAQQDGFRQATDDRLLDSTSEIDRVLFSQDDDLFAEAKRRQVEGVQFTGVIYAHQMRITIGQCVQELELIAKLAEPEELANRVEFLPL